MLLWSSLLITIAVTCVAFVPTFTAYVIFRFFLGVALAGSNFTRICLAVEWTPIEKRVLVHTCNMYAFTFGQILLAGWAYLIPEWRWLQFSTSASYGIVLLFSLVVPESARWLITHNKLHMALKALQKVAWINGHKEQGRTLTPEIILDHIQEDLSTVKTNSSFKDVFWTPGLRKVTFCVIFVW
ncbi:solute carrier family 22 member 20-like [Sminthopsis crassicaudata]|uniref:solute carrier family 22 member 20-like n=1 Tax=Sminthopsis crassicaudata TaxID=9301 RepID=UPI003D6807C7